MATNNSAGSPRNVLRAWVRYDGEGKVVPGSVIQSRTKPKVGNWVEIPLNTCCTTTTIIIN